MSAYYELLCSFRSQLFKYFLCIEKIKLLKIYCKNMKLEVSCTIWFWFLGLGLFFLTVRREHTHKKVFGVDSSITREGPSSIQPSLSRLHAGHVST